MVSAYETYEEDASLSFDVVIVGAGPAGLSAAIRLKQLNIDLSVCVLEKGSEVGSHLLSGCVFDPCALTELLPQWSEDGALMDHLTPVAHDSFRYLTVQSSWGLPLPPTMRNQGNYILSLGHLCRWLAQVAQNLGVEIYPGFAVVDGIFNEEESLIGVKTGDMGRDAAGEPTAHYQPGMVILARQTILAEGCRGSLSERLMDIYDLRKGKNPQTYGLGLKEIWEIDPAKSSPGSVMHSIGWPLDHDTYGGSFVYHLRDHKIAIGFVVGLDYKNPYLSPFEEFQRFKTHPDIRPLLEGGRRIAYGARALTEGGWQSIPKLSFPGGVLVGCAAGFMNVPRLKGVHTAMKSGMLAAESIIQCLTSHATEAISYPEMVKDSWIRDELYHVRNIRPGFQKGLMVGLLNAALETYFLRGKGPWTLTHHFDHQATQPKEKYQPISYPKPDGVLTFDRLSSVFLCAIHHEENQPCHLKLINPSLAMSINYPIFDSPEQRYCPAGVYEIVNGQRLQINSANCIHCKTCDIKDPLQNIRWTPPQGGSGPSYGEL